jgi:hypothetical protein
MTESVHDGDPGVVPAQAMTVLGPVDVGDLGLTLMHEHLLHDGTGYPCWFLPSADQATKGVAEMPVTMEILGYLQRSPFICRDNTRLVRSDPVVNELVAFRAAGGSTIVELTNRGMSPDPEGLVNISRKAAVNVIAGCGFYVDHTIAAWVRPRSVDDLTTQILGELLDGIAGTRIRAGVIGEVGTLGHHHAGRGEEPARRRPGIGFDRRHDNGSSRYGRPAGVRGVPHSYVRRCVTGPDSYEPYGRGERPHVFASGR